MPKIKKIKILKNKVTVSFDDQNKIELDKSVYTEFYLYVGKEVSKKEIKQIEDYNLNAALMNYALKIRQKSLYSEYKMREKLYDKGGNKKTVDYVIKMMKAHDLIDDQAFIEEHIEYYNDLNYGKNKIIHKLMDKGIFEEKLEKINFPVSIERKKANNIFDKMVRKYDKYNDSQKKRHIYEGYLSQGFDIDIAREMSEKVKSSNPKEENKKLESDFNKAYERFKKKYSKKEIKSKLIAYLASKGYKIGDIIKMIERKNI